MTRYLGWVAALATVVVGVSTVPLRAQIPDYPLAPLKPAGDIVAPFFDGWYSNPDGTYTLSFGFMNRNTEQVVDIPLGPDNFIEPAQFGGVQPTHFPQVYYGGFNGRRERGTFAIRIPADFAGRDVVWTITHAGHTYSIPGRVTSPAYELSRNPAGLGSLPPAVRFSPEGTVSSDREGIYSDPLTVRANEAASLSIQVQDRGEQIPGSRERSRVPVGVYWVRHQGPGAIEFDRELHSVDSVDEYGWGEARTMATFREPGEYVIRARVDNFRAPDSGFDYQCCWSNAYVRVTVTP